MKCIVCSEPLTEVEAETPTLGDGLVCDKCNIAHERAHEAAELERAAINNTFCAIGMLLRGEIELVT